MNTTVKRKDTLLAKIVIMDIVELTEVLHDARPEIIEQATRKPYLTREELMDLTGWSSRTLQHLRDTKQIPFVQHSRKILYQNDGISAFLENH